MLVKVYCEQLANIGDTIMATSNPFKTGNWIVGYEYEVVKLGHGYIVVTSDRLPNYKKEITISDKYYQVVKYVDEKDVPKSSVIYNLIPFLLPVGLVTVVILSLKLV